MRRPSSRVLANTCDIYPLTAARDRDGGTTGGSYDDAPAFAGVPCSAQGDGGSVQEQGDGRVTQVTVWTVLCGPEALGYGLKTRDKLVLHVHGVDHTAFLDSDCDGAGRGAYAGFTATEHR